MGRMVIIRSLLQMEPREGKQVGQDNPERKGRHWPLAKPAGSHPCPLCCSFLMPLRARAFLSQRLCPRLPLARVLGCWEGGWQQGHCGPFLTHISPAETWPEIVLSILTAGSHLGRLPCSAVHVLSRLICRGQDWSHACHASHFPVSHLSCHPPPPSLAEAPLAAPGVPAHLVAEPRKLPHRVPSSWPASFGGPSSSSQAVLRPGPLRAASLPARVCGAFSLPAQVCGAFSLPASHPGPLAAMFSLQRPLPSLTPLLLDHPGLPTTCRERPLHLLNSPPLLAQPRLLLKVADSPHIHAPAPSRSPLSQCPLCLAQGLKHHPPRGQKAWVEPQAAA